MTDNDVYTIVYLCKNGFYPDKYALQSESIKNVLPYFEEEDEVIVLTQGLINWNFVRLSNLIATLSECKILKSFKIYSTIELPMNCDYTLVKGDLFYGKYVDYSKRKWGKPYDANISSIYAGHDKEIEPMCFDFEESDDEDTVVVPKEMPLHLVEIDISRKDK